MEAALIKLKQRNDELQAKTKDHTDGQSATPTISPTTEKADEEFEKIKEEVESQNRDHGERIVEMVSETKERKHSTFLWRTHTYTLREFTQSAGCQHTNTKILYVYYFRQINARFFCFSP